MRKFMNKQYIKVRLIALENYLNQNWKGLSDHFIERLLARAEYDNLIKQYNEQTTITN